MLRRCSVYCQSRTLLCKLVLENTMKNTSIKEIHLAKLRVLRAEFADLAKDNTRRNEARRRAEEHGMTWELVKLGVKPIHQRRLCK